MRYDLLALSRIVFKLLSTGATIWAILSGYQLIAIATIALISSFSSNLTFYFIAKHLEPEVGVRVGSVNKVTIKALTGYSAWAFFIDVSRLLKERGDLWVIGYLLTASQLTVYYVALRLVEYATQFLFSAVNMTTPLFATDFSRKDFDAFSQKLYLFTRLNAILGCITVFGFILFAEEFFSLWMGESFDANTAFQICCIVLVGKMIAFSSSPVGNSLMAINKPKTLSFVVAFEAVVGLTASYFLILEYGLKGAAVGVVLPFLFTRTFLIFYLLKKDISFSILVIYKNYIKSAFVLAVPFLTVLYSKLYLADLINMVYLAVLMLLFVLLTYISLPVLFTSKEKEELKIMLPGKIFKLLFGLSILFNSKPKVNRES